MNGANTFIEGLLIDGGSLRILACEKAERKVSNKQTIARRRFMALKILGQLKLAIIFTRQSQKPCLGKVKFKRTGKCFNRKWYFSQPNQ